MTAFEPKTLRGDWSYPTRVRFGPGRIVELPEACRALGMARPLLVTDPGLAEHALGRRVLEIAQDAGLACGLFAAIRPNPTGADVERGVEALREGGHDGVIALGGGSGLDAAKAIAFMAGQERPLWDFEDRGDNWLRAKVEGILPVVAVPTTAGTGSEVGRAAVITNEAAHTKCIVFHPRMLPGQVIADPELTLGLPRTLTVWTGFDALSHNLEALCAPGFHPLADGIATEGIRLVHGWLRTGGPGGRESRRARRHAGGGEHGRDRVPERPRRDACAGAPDRRPARQPARPHHRDRHALRADAQPPGDRASPRRSSSARWGWSRAGFRAWVSELRQELGDARRRSPPSACARSTSRCWRRAPPPTRAPPAIRSRSSAGDYAALYRQALAG